MIVFAEIGFQPGHQALGVLERATVSSFILNARYRWWLYQKDARTFCPVGIDSANMIPANKHQACATVGKIMETGP
jgi:hypothetical protein